MALKNTAQSKTDRRGLEIVGRFKVSECSWQNGRSPARRTGIVVSEIGTAAGCRSTHAAFSGRSALYSMFVSDQINAVEFVRIVNK